MISSAALSNNNNNHSIITTRQLPEEEENTRKLEISFSKTVPSLINANDDHDEQIMASEQQDLFEIKPLSSTVLAISLKELANNAQVSTDEIIQVLSKALSKYLSKKEQLSSSTHKKELSLLGKVMELLKQFSEWAKENAWEVFLFRLFDCIIVFCVLFFMRHILPKSVTRVLEWFIDPLVDFEGFPFSKPATSNN
ncbi:hypothetical protein C9374_014493 [Naegleria lovaniensis]|uniref:Uncharacterized protein n=1 Tax=Naegleria lovaniensis TaxID=51637 RepID=A0AA88KP64_NAELO|nr:uncharacterized protein C9374_014493 [Naegleria lovaniensis]KAG2389093.1 hypothetical protein C9374_014493 [Naegleria lovaniensis]